MKRFTLVLSLILLSNSFFTTQAYALSYTFTTISGIDPRGINDSGQIVGNSFHASDEVFPRPVIGGFDDVPPAPGGWTIPYLYSGGTYTPLSTELLTNPGRGGPSHADDINNSGQIVWTEGHFTYVTPADNLSMRRGVFGNTDSTSGPFANATFGINNLGQVVGRSDAAHSIIDSHTGVFIARPPFFGPSMLPIDINDSGAILGEEAIAHTGYLFSTYTYTSFLFENGTATPIAFPGARTTTVAPKINNAGDIVGGYTNADGTGGNFIFNHGVYTPVDAPGLITGINDLGWIVGEGDGGGFLGIPDSPTPEPSSLILFGSGTGALLLHVVRVRRRQAMA